MNLRYLLLVFGLAAGFATSAQESAPLNSDRPGQTFASSTIAVGALQIQTGFDWNYIKNTNDVYTTPVYLRYGVTNRLELNAGITPIFNNVLSPFPTFELGLRYHLVQGDQFNLTGHGRYFSADGFILGTLSSYWIMANASYVFNDGSSLNSTFGYVYASSEEDIFGFDKDGSELYLTLNYGIPIGEKWGVFIEGAYFLLNKTTMPAYQLGIFEGVDLGVSYLIQPNLQLDFFTNAPFSFGTSDGKTVWTEAFFSFGVTWRVLK